MESSETPLQSPGDTSTSLDAQPPTPALQAPEQGSKGLQALSQERQPSADALEEKGETCSAPDPVGTAAWNLVGFFGEEVEGGVKDLTQQEKVGKTEEEIKAVPEAQPVGDTAAGAELAVEEEQPHDQGQPGSEGALCAGITRQEGNILSLRETPSEAEPGQGCEMEPPADTGGVPIGRGWSLPAVQVAGQPEPSLCAELLEGTARAKIRPAEISPQSPQWAELTRLVEGMSQLNLQNLSEVVAKLSPAEVNPQSPQWAELSRLVEAMSRLTLQSPSEVTAKGVAGLHPTPPVSQESSCPQLGSLEPPTQLPDPLKQGMQGSVSPAQGMGSLGCAGPEGPSELLQQPRVLEEGDAEGKAARENILQVPLHLPCTELKAEEGGEPSVTSDAGDEM